MVQGTPSSVTETRCRACGGGALSPVLSLGETPLANALLSQAELAVPEERFPLDLVYCNGCTLLQITCTVSPEKLFRNYAYMSSFSDTMVQHAKDIALRCVESEKLGPQSLVVEVASNDGYLLQHYRDKAVPVLGIEPAENIAKVAVERGIPTRADFFGLDVAKKLAAEGLRADVIHANNVLAHVADLPGVVAGFEALLKDSGVAVVEAPYAREFIERCEFDTIYHEHLCYFSLTALDRLAEQCGLVVADVEVHALHGGSLRLFLRRAKGHTRGPRVVAMLAEEKSWGVSSLGTYETFATRVGELKESLLRTLSSLKAQGKRVAAYGAAAKGATLLNHFGIGSDALEFVVDRSTVKQGKFMPGVHLPILPPAELVARAPDYCLLLTWNFEAEILAQQADYRKQGGKFIVPIPSVRIQ